MQLKLKPGIKSSEFYISIAAGLVSVLLAALGMVDAEWAAVSVTILGTVYTLIRGGLKSKS